MTFPGAAGPDSVYLQSWGGLALVFVYYVTATIFLHWTSLRAVSVTRYEPPSGISPALAGYLFENGRCERAFAATLVSLGVKSYLEIQQNKDWFKFKRLREADNSLAPEEAVALSEIFDTGNDTYKFGVAEHSQIFLAFGRVEKSLHESAEPRFISSHNLIWGIGVVSLALLAGRLFVFEPIAMVRPARGTFAMLAFTTGLGGFCLFGALRAWSATFRRVATYLPNSKGPKRPLGWNDMFPVWLSAGAIVPFGLLAVVISVRFAVFVVASALVAVGFRNILKAPTSTGRKLMSDLLGFRNFLERAEGDQMTQENESGVTPRVLRRYSAYGVALDVERGWGEEFTEDLLEMLQFDKAVATGGPPVPRDSSPVEDRLSTDNFFDDDSIIQLNLGSRK
jgi:hypothetical protein